MASGFLLSAALAACSGGNISAPTGPLGQVPATAAPSATATATASPGPSAAPTAIAATAVQPTFAAVASTPVAVGAAGSSAAIALPNTGSASAGGTFTLALPAGQTIPAGAAAAALAAPAGSGTLAGGVPQIASLARTTQSINGIAVTPVYYMGLQFTGFSGSFTIQLPQLQLKVPSVPSGAGVALALFDPARSSLGWQQNFAFGSPAVSVANNIATFTPPVSTITVYPNVIYWLAVYVYPLTAGTPTTAPSVAPSQPAVTPSPVPTATATPVTTTTASPAATPTPVPGSTSAQLATTSTNSAVPTGPNSPANTTAQLAYSSSTGGSVNITTISASPAPGIAAFTPAAGGQVAAYFTIQNPGTTPITLNNASMTYSLAKTFAQNFKAFPNGPALYLALTSNGSSWLGNIAPATLNASVTNATFTMPSVTLAAGTTYTFAAYAMPGALVSYAQPSPGPQTVLLQFTDPTNTISGSFRTAVNTQGASSFSAINAGISIDPSGTDMPVFSGPYPSGATGKNVVYGELLWLADPASSSVLSMNGNGGTVSLTLSIPNASTLAKTYYLIGFDGPATGAFAPSAPLASTTVSGNTVTFTTTAGRTFVPNGNYGFVIVY